MAIPRFDYFRYGRGEAGMDWYKPQAPGWLQSVGSIAKALPGAVGAGMRAYAGQKLLGGPGGEMTSAGAPGSAGVTGGAPTAFDNPFAEAAPGEISRGRSGAFDNPFAEAAPGEIAPPAAYSAPGVQPQFTPRMTPEQRKRLFMMMIYSSRALKDNVNRADERRSLREVMDTPTYRYRYHDEPEGTQARLGPMAEEVPERWRVTDPRSGLAMIKMPAYLGAMHASIRALGRDVQTLKEQLRG
jgi:Chaperone of endosialidase